MEFVQPIRDRKVIDRMKKVLRSESIRDYVLFVLGINSGLRVSDLLSFKVMDVMDDKGRVRDRITLREKKTGKVKDFPVSSTASKALSEYMETCNLTGDDPLFPFRKGQGSITRIQAYRILNEAARVVGIKDSIGTHTLRKTLAITPIRWEWIFPSSRSCSTMPVHPSPSPISALPGMIWTMST